MVVAIAELQENRKVFFFNIKLVGNLQRTLVKRIELAVVNERKHEGKEQQQKYREIAFNY